MAVVALRRRSGGHHRLQVGALRVLPLALVRVLVAAERLRRREVAAAVVALELAPAAGIRKSTRTTRRGIRTTVVVIVIVITIGGGSGGGGGGGGSGSFLDVGSRGVVRDVDPEEADGRGGSGGGGGLVAGRGGADEGELGEGVDGHEVVSLALAHRTGTATAAAAAAAHVRKFGLVTRGRTKRSQLVILLSFDSIRLYIFLNGEVWMFGGCILVVWEVCDVAISFVVG